MSRWAVVIYWGGLQWMQRSYGCKSITAWRSVGMECASHSLPFTNPIHHHLIYPLLLQISLISPSVPLRLAHAPTNMITTIIHITVVYYHPIRDCCVRRLGRRWIFAMHSGWRLAGEEVWEEKATYSSVSGRACTFRKFLYVCFVSSFRIWKLITYFICSQIDDYIKTCNNCSRGCNEKAFDVIKVSNPNNLSVWRSIYNSILDEFVGEMSTHELDDRDAIMARACHGTSRAL